MISTRTRGWPCALRSSRPSCGNCANDCDKTGCRGHCSTPTDTGGISRPPTSRCGSAGNAARRLQASASSRRGMNPQNQRARSGVEQLVIQADLDGLDLLLRCDVIPGIEKHEARSIAEAVVIVLGKCRPVRPGRGDHPFDAATDGPSAAAIIRGWGGAATVDTIKRLKKIPLILIPCGAA